MGDKQRSGDLHSQVKSLLRFRVLLIPLLALNLFLIASVPFASSKNPEGAAAPAKPTADKTNAGRRVAAAGDRQQGEVDQSAIDKTAGSPNADAATDTAAVTAAQNNSEGGKPGTAQSADVQTGDVSTDGEQNSTNPLPAPYRAAVRDAFRQLGASIAHSSGSQAAAFAGAGKATSGLVRAADRWLEIARTANPVETTSVVNVEAPRQELELVNPQFSGGPVRYVVDGTVYSLQPGQRHKLIGGRTRLVEFHRGGESGDATHALTSGQFVFHVTQKGWELTDRAELSRLAAQ